MDENKILEIKSQDGYEEQFGEGQESLLFSTVTEMEHNSEWIPDLEARNIRVETLSDIPLLWEEPAIKYQLNRELAAETAQYGTNLLIDLGVHGVSSGSWELVRSTAMTGVFRVAALRGSAFKRMKCDKYVQTLNNGLEVAEGRALALLRYGKVSGLHSGGPKGYKIMNISDLLDVTANSVRQRFGTAEFLNGYNSHSLTRASWLLPDAQSRLMEVYAEAVKKANGIPSHYAISYMPGVNFCSSDTTNSSASLIPVFYRGDTALQYVDGIRVRHKKKDKDDDGVEQFSNEIGKIFAQFEEATKTIAKLTTVPIYHPKNCCIKLCREFGIGEKWGQAALDEVERIAYGETYISANDLFIAMNEILSEAIRLEAPQRTYNTLEDALANIAKSNFAKFDVSGDLAWENTKRKPRKADSDDYEWEVA